MACDDGRAHSTVEENNGILRVQTLDLIHPSRHDHWTERYRHILLLELVNHALRVKRASDDTAKAKLLGEAHGPRGDQVDSEPEHIMHDDTPDTNRRH
jgi:hypothetical protein